MWLIFGATAGYVAIDKIVAGDMALALYMGACAIGDFWLAVDAWKVHCSVSALKENVHELEVVVEEEITDAA